MVMKSEELGRSMIEMLGVLAIVGILSVGAITGYGKAMRKYKYNKLAGEYTEFVQELYKYKKDFVKEKNRVSPSAHLHISSYIAKMGILPASWKVSGGMITDGMGNRLSPFIFNADGGDNKNVLNMDYALMTDNRNELCIFMFSNIIMNSSEWLVTAGTYTATEGRDEQAALEWFGDNYCRAGRRCIRNMTMTDILNTCSFCSEKFDEAKECTLVIKY